MVFCELRHYGVLRSSSNTISRKFLLLSVVALMVVILAMSVAPAFAAQPTYACTDPTGSFQTIVPSSDKQFFVKLGYECVRQPRA